MSRGDTGFTMSSMKILVADQFPEPVLDELRARGCDVRYRPKLNAPDLSAEIRGIDVLVVRSTKVNAACINGADQLALIVRAGAGVNTIDVGAASARGIFVTNCPGKNSIAVAELTMGLLLAVDRRIPENAADFKAGVWNKGLYGEADGLAGSTFGIIGLGQIGREVARRAQAFGMSVWAWSRSLTDEEAEEMEIGRCETVDDLIARCRIVSLHCALTAETRGLLSRARIAAMQPRAILLNTARAELVDEAALAEALHDGRLRAGIDVMVDEPEGKAGSVLSPLGGCPNVVATHHIGASTEQAQMAVAREAVRIILEYRASGRVANWVNRSDATPARWQLVVRHHDKPGVLANVLNELKEAHINAEEIENVVFEGNRTACCTIRLDQEPAPETLAGIRARLDEVISATLFEL